MAQLTRADFDNSEDWHRYCHQGGLLPFEREKPYRGIQPSGFYESLFAGIYGHTAREHLRSFGLFGVSHAIPARGLLKTYRAVAFLKMTRAELIGKDRIGAQIGNALGDRNSQEREVIGGALLVWLPRILPLDVPVEIETALLNEVIDDSVSRG